MTERVICAAVGIALVALSAQALAETSPQPVAKPIGPAIDLKARGFVRQTFEFDSNRELEPDSDGAVYGSITRLGLRLDAEGKRSVFRINAALAARAFGGPGDTDNLTRVDPDISARHQFNAKDFAISNSLSLNVRPTTETQFDDTGIVEEEANQLTINYDTSFTKNLDARNALSLGGDVRITRFDEDVAGLDENELYGVDATWSHQLYQTTSLFAQTGARFFNSEDGTTSQTFNFLTGIDHRRTSRHRFGANGGIVVSRIDDGDVPGASKETNVGFNGGGNFEYTLQRFTAGVDIRQSVDPTSDGDVNGFTRIGGNIGYRLTNRSRLSGALEVSRRTSVSTLDDEEDRLFFSVGPAFNTELTRNIDLSLSYRFRFDDEDDEAIGTGHQLFLTISRNFDLIE
ncbi:MAG: hypothetical protein AAGE80_13920 [Pseudomonadota bacterium]